MSNQFPRFLLLLALLSPAYSASGLELFGVTVESSTRATLKSAGEQAGLVLISESGEGQLYDVYDSSAVLSGSKRLYFGFVSQDQSFAFAEYELSGLQSKSMLQKMIRKYGQFEPIKGRFLSDRGYRWRVDGVDIELRSDWKNYRTRLSYIIPQKLAAMLQPGQAGAVQAGEKPSTSVY